MKLSIPNALNRSTKELRGTLKYQVETLEKSINDAWAKGDFVRQLSHEDIPQIPHGIQLSKWECMILGKLNDCVQYEVGELVLAFPPGGSPAELVPHTHGGARIITIYWKIPSQKRRKMDRY